MPTSASANNPLALYHRLTPRDRNLLALLDEHLVLTTDQVHRLHYRAMRTCQIRLRELYALGLLDRFRFARLYGGSEPWHWVLGLHGARFMAGATGRPAPTVRAHRDQVHRLAASPRLSHLLATNEFFVRLAFTARINQRVRLDRWWSERTATTRFMRVRPDGHGLWTARGRTVGWFLETDMGTEPLTRVTAKLEAYERLAASGGPTYPVLFWLPNADRESHLQQMLRGMLPEVPVVTATHDTDPADAVWLPVDGWQRISLAELHTDHGMNTASNPNWVAGQLDLSGQADLAA
ncbi:replication-relaxation family protein [Micromonospora sp. Llam7]|uniref:replication-relaxation family protein n=1 Tax=Micromonospora tarapacensis TaxID=2835305 RepID=UPI001C832CF2|nr:replication-relaxation family protein [Micromonospora tarapacensis]MBX7267571.1 replication-relaxation family protein [Micromonospora tarapacensis]